MVLRKAVRLRVGDRIWIDDRHEPFKVLETRVQTDTVGPNVLVTVQRADNPETVLAFYDDDSVRLSISSFVAGIDR